MTSRRELPEAAPAAGTMQALLGPALPLRLALLDLVLRPGGPWYVRPAALALAALGLLSARVLLGAPTWLALFALAALRLVADWPLSDNHQYLAAFTWLAAGLALGARPRNQMGSVVTPGDSWLTLARAARWLLALTFVFASLWKGVLAPDYRDGRFFRVTFLTDTRFTDATMLLGGLTAENLAFNREALAPFPEGAVPFEPARLREPPAFRRLVLAATWGMLAIEVGLAAAWLVPVAPASRWATLRHGLLLAFVLVTYAFAPVGGFAWILVVLGLAACPLERRRLRAAYLFAFLLVLFYEDVPWAGLLGDYWTAA